MSSTQNPSEVPKAGEELPTFPQFYHTFFNKLFDKMLSTIEKANASGVNPVLFQKLRDCLRSHDFIKKMVNDEVERVKMLDKTTITPDLYDSCVEFFAQAHEGLAMINSTVRSTLSDWASADAKARNSMEFSKSSAVPPAGPPPLASLAPEGVRSEGSRAHGEDHREHATTYG